MSIGIPVNLGIASLYATSSSVAMTVGSSVAAGTLVVIGVASGGANSISSVADTAGNTWTAGTIQAVSGVRLGVYYSRIANSITSGDSITLTVSGATGFKAVAAVAIPNSKGPTTADAFDRYDATSGTTTALSLTQAANMAQADEIVLGLNFCNGNGDTWTEDTTNGWTEIDSTANNGVFRWAYKIVSSVTPVTRNPTNSTSRLQLMNLNAFKGDGVAPVTARTPTTMLLGV